MPDTAVTEIEFTMAPTVGTMAQAPAVAPPAPPVPQEPTTILNIIERASRDPAVDIDKLDRLLAMHERVKADSARIEFDNAMASAQEEMKAIRADLANNQTKSKYASYAALDHAIRPIYTRHGFAVSLNTGDAPTPDAVRVLATVSHRGGHRQDYRIDMPADGKGPQGASVMTRTHATGAAASYGQRYISKLIWNLAVGEVDDDGNGADGDIESLATGPRGADGRPLSTYDVTKVKKAQEWADAAVQRLNLMSGPAAQQEAIAWRDEARAVPKGKRTAPLDWLKENSPGQYLRVRQVYQNVTGDDLELE